MVQLERIILNIIRPKASWFFLGLSFWSLEIQSAEPPEPSKLTAATTETQTPARPSITPGAAPPVTPVSAVGRLSRVVTATRYYAYAPISYLGYLTGWGSKSAPEVTPVANPRGSLPPPTSQPIPDAPQSVPAQRPIPAAPAVQLDIIAAPAPNLIAAPGLHSTMGSGPRRLPSFTDFFIEDPAATSPACAPVPAAAAVTDAHDSRLDFSGRHSAFAIAKPIRPLITTTKPTEHIPLSFTRSIHNIIMQAASENKPELLTNFLACIKASHQAMLTKTLKITTPTTDALLIKVLQQRDAKLNNTPLHTAVLMGDPKLVKIIEKTANKLGIYKNLVHSTNYYRHTPYDLITDAHRPRSIKSDFNGTSYDTTEQTVYAAYVHAGKIDSKKQINLARALYPDKAIPDGKNIPIEASLEPRLALHENNPTTQEAIDKYLRRNQELRGKSEKIRLKTQIVASLNIKTFLTQAKKKQSEYDKNFADAQARLCSGKSLENRLRQHELAKYPSRATPIERKLALIPKLLDRLT